MLSLCLLSLAILMLSAGIALWMADTGLAGRSLRYTCSFLAASVIISVLFDFTVIASIHSWGFILASLLIGGLFFFYQRCKMPKYNAIYFEPGIYALAIIIAVYFLSCQFIPYSGRWGRWDAKAIWTLHALFLTHSHGWGNMFSPLISWSHPDYPLMLSSLIAMCWKAMGTTDALVPCAIAWLVFVFVLLTVSSGLKQKDRTLAGIAGLIPFFFCNEYMRMAASQGADTLLSLFMLLSLLIARQNTKTSNVKLLFLTGFIAGFAGWVKNEGIAFSVVFSFAILWQWRKTPQTALYYLAGMILPILVILAFKFFYSPTNDIIAGQGQSTMLKLSDISRYKLVLHFFLHQAWHLYPALIMLVGLIIIIGYRRLVDWQLLVIVSMLAVYFFTFVLTPRDLRWHLETASDRLFLQLFPAAVYVLVSMVAED